MNAWESHQSTEKIQERNLTETKYQQVIAPEQDVHSDPEKELERGHKLWILCVKCSHTNVKGWFGALYFVGFLPASLASVVQVLALSTEFSSPLMNT